MKRLMLLLLACGTLSSCVVVPVVGRYERQVYVEPAATAYPTYTYRYYTY
jgi:hypothetical protein